jgi:hypothetical protein
MDKSIQAVCKNTFISFVATDADESVPVSLLPSSRLLPPRSRSAESVRNRPEAEEFQELTHQSLQRLNVALSMGISSPRQSFSTEADSELTDATFKLNGGNDFSELRLLRNRLAKALDSPKSLSMDSPKGIRKTWNKDLRVASSCSLSTMAPDDMSECGETFSSGGLRRMPKVWSSGSVSTMVSDWNDMFDEDDEVEFELDIKEVSSAAVEDRATTCSSPLCSASALASVCASSKQAQLEMSHSQVPRNHNMEEMYKTTQAEPPTTMMIRNMPGRYSQNDLMMDLQKLGLAGTYDFLYIPIDKRTAANVGYAFVNFVDHVWAARCIKRFEGYRFSQQKKSSNKLGTVSVAFLQGLEKNLQHYENSAVNMSRDKRRKPVVMPNIAQACR